MLVCVVRFFLSLSRHLQLGAIAAVEELGALDDNGVNVGDGATDEHAGGRSGGGSDSSHVEEKW